jgi:hypothetical protein
MNLISSALAKVKGLEVMFQAICDEKLIIPKMQTLYKDEDNGKFYYIYNCFNVTGEISYFEGTVANKEEAKGKPVEIPELYLPITQFLKAHPRLTEVPLPCDHFCDQSEPTGVKKEEEEEKEDQTGSSLKNPVPFTESI